MTERSYLELVERVDEALGELVPLLRPMIPRPDLPPGHTSWRTINGPPWWSPSYAPPYFDWYPNADGVRLMLRSGEGEPWWETFLRWGPEPETPTLRLRALAVELERAGHYAATQALLKVAEELVVGTL